MAGEGTITNAAGSTNSKDVLKVPNVGVASVLAWLVDTSDPAVSTTIPTTAAPPAIIASKARY
jgi:hypothetical protein